MGRAIGQRSQLQPDPRPYPRSLFGANPQRETDGARVMGMLCGVKSLLGVRMTPTRTAKLVWVLFLPFTHTKRRACICDAQRGLLPGRPSASQLAVVIRHTGAPRWARRAIISRGEPAIPCRVTRFHSPRTLSQDPTRAPHLCASRHPEARRLPYVPWCTARQTAVLADWRRQSMC